LKLSESKTRITHIEKGFDFLGKHFQKHGGKLLSKPSRQNVQAFLTEIKATFRENLHAPVDLPPDASQPQNKGLGNVSPNVCQQEGFQLCGLPHLL